MQSLWKQIESCPSIEIVGYMKDLEDFYLNCDLFCLPSVDEGFGMVVYEAIACGCPVLVTQNVGASDIVRNEETGFIVEARRADVIAEKIQLMYKDRDRLSNMSQNCRTFYENYKKSSDTLEQQVRQLIESIKRGT